MAIGAARSPELARRASATIAAMLRKAGFTMNFAPVLDVSAGPNRSLDRRRFHDDPQIVASLGRAWIAGHKDAGVVAVAKHFPGHGSSPDDSHETLPHNAASPKTLSNRDLAPFRAAIDEGVEAIITAHLRVPALAEDDRIPASMSRRVLTEVLRGQLGFQGLIISDEIRMKALRQSIEPGEAALAALLAGADMIMVAALPQERERIFETLVAALESGHLPAGRVQRSVSRILRLKYRLAQQTATSTLQDDSAFREVAAEAVTVLGNRQCILPVDVEALGARILYLGQAHAMSPALANATRVVWGHNTSGLERRIDAALRGAPSRIVFAADNAADLELARHTHAQAPKVPFILIWTGDPYALLEAPRADAYVLTYGQQPDAIRSAMATVTGRHEAAGRLPVTLFGRMRDRNRCESRSNSPQ
jgi:beta-N-acetylhexosaminidase